MINKLKKLLRLILKVVKECIDCDKIKLHFKFLFLN